MMRTVCTGVLSSQADACDIMADAVIMAAVATKPFANRPTANRRRATPAIRPLTTTPTISNFSSSIFLHLVSRLVSRLLPNQVSPAFDRLQLTVVSTDRLKLRAAPLQTSFKSDHSSDHNDIRADCGATLQIRYTTIHRRLRICGRLYELR